MNSFLTAFSVVPALSVFIVVLDALTPAERLAFVLHDLFDLSFDEIAAMMEKSPSRSGAVTRPVGQGHTDDMLPLAS